MMKIIGCQGPFFVASTSGISPPFRRTLRSIVGAVVAFAAAPTSPTVMPDSPYYHLGFPRAWCVKHGSLLRHFGAIPFADRPLVSLIGGGTLRMPKTS